MADSETVYPSRERLRSSDPDSEEEKLHKTTHRHTGVGIQSKDHQLSKRHLIARLVFHVFCLAWLAPILWALIVNFRVTIIGASAYCPDGKCFPSRFDITNLGAAWTAARKLDLDSHDLLGALQFAAKALEVWFIVIAAAAVYLWTMKLAEREEGLPMRYLTWPNEFGDILAILSGSFWTSARWRQSREGPSMFPLKVFVLSTVLICILCNLMGPAVAVLIIPALQWLPTPTHGDKVFGALGGNIPPDAGLLLSVIENTYQTQQCTTADFVARNYSCSVDTLGMTLDMLVDQYIAWDNGYTYDHGTIEQGSVSSYLYNTTDKDIYGYSSLWVANRYTLDALSADFDIMSDLAFGENYTYISQYFPEDVESYAVFNRSLDIRVQRNGPMIGVRPNDWYATNADGTTNSVWTTEIDTNRSVRCYENYSVLFGATPPYLRCIQVGNGWSTVNKQTSFSIANSYEPSTGQNRPGAIFNITFSDKVASFDTLPSWVDHACLSNFEDGSVPDDTRCDWNRFFEQHVPPMANRSASVSTWEIWRSDNTTTPISTSDFVAWYNFTTYELDPSPLTNPMLMARSFNVPDKRTPLVIDPSWALVAWSADAFGTIAANRTAALHLVDELQEGTYGNGSPVFLSIMHMLSLIPYSSYHIGQIMEDETHPRLTREGYVYVYAYALTSRTSKLAVVVAIGGVAVVVAYEIFALLVFRLKYPPSKSLPQFIVAALEHHPQDEFADAVEPKESVKTRFKVRHTDNGPGELVYRRARLNLGSHVTTE